MILPQDFNYHSREWTVLRDSLEKERESAVEKLCNLECDPTNTAQLRGRIALIKDILLGAEAAARERLRQGGNLNGN